jgi:glycine/D-amino acid oxidase-like deaminating enzyme
MRLTSPSIRPAGRPIRLIFDGRDISALEGETVAAALSAAGILRFRDTPTGAPRGLYCGMGACFDCVVTIDGRIGQRACLAKAADGMRIGSAAALPLADLAEPPPPGEDVESVACDVLVVGGGPAGLSAGIAAAEAGAAVIVLDERDQPGGQYLKPLAASHADAGPDAQAREGHRLRARAAACGLCLVAGATVWGAFAPDEIAAVVDGRAVTYRPRRLILATGAHERPVPLPGWTLPGVMTTGAMQTLARAQRVSPGGTVLIAGSGPLNLQLACELLAGGVRVAAVVEAAAHPGPAAVLPLWRHAPDLAWQGARMLARLRLAGVPVLWGSAVTLLEGEDRVRTAQIRTPRGTRAIAAEVVALNLGFQPEVGLARALGLAHRFVDAGLGHLATETDPDGRSSVATVFAVGDGAALGGARVAMARGRLAGLAAARDLGFMAPEDPAARGAMARAEAFQAALWRLFAPPAFDAASLDDSTIVCRCEAVTAGRLRAELDAGLASVAALKKATRAGMGRCQGRFCAATLARLCPHAPEPQAFAAPRAPVKPVPAAALMLEAGEFIAPLLRNPTPPRHPTPVRDQPTETRVCDTLVIGGGVVGLSCAYFLARGGGDVLVAERDEAAMTASTANAGSLHIQVLPYDFDDSTPPDSPLIETLKLAPRSVALWQEIAAEAGESLGLRTEGGLVLAETEAELRSLRAKAEMEARAGVETHLIGANELRNLAPAVSERMLGAVFCPGEGYGDPLRGAAALRRLSQAHGARLLTGAEVTGLSRTAQGWEVATTRGTVRARRVVNAAGPWAGVIAAMVGLDLPVTGTVQQVIVTEPAPRFLEHLIAMSGRHLSLKQQANGSVLVGGGWFGAYDAASGRTANLRRNIQGNLWTAARAVPALRGLQIIRCWTGINTAIDHAPILGEAPGLPGFWNAVTATGYTLGPGCGEAIAAAILHGEKLRPGWTVERFGVRA